MKLTTAIHSTGLHSCVDCPIIAKMSGCYFVRFVSVEAKLSFVEPGRRWAHSPSSKAPGISCQGTMKTSVRKLQTSGGLSGCYFLPGPALAVDSRRTEATAPHCQSARKPRPQSVFPSRWRFVSFGAASATDELQRASREAVLALRL